MVLRKEERELIRIVGNKAIMQKNVGVSLGSKGQTRDFNKKRHLSRLYNKKNNSLKELI